MKICQEMQ